MKHQWKNNFKNPRQGFTLIEVMLAMVIFLMMTLMFAAVFPFAIRGAQHSTNYSQAVLIAQHKIDELKAAGYSHMNYTDLSNLGVIDTTATSSPYAFTAVDNLDSGTSVHGFFPPGSTGTVTIVDYSTLNSAAPTGKLDYITVRIDWTGSGVSAGYYQVSTLIRSS